MANTESSAVVRFIEMVNAEPIIEMAVPRRVETVSTEVVRAPKRERKFGRYLLTAALLVGVGVGVGIAGKELGVGASGESANRGLAGGDVQTANAPQLPPKAAPAAAALPAEHKADGAAAEAVAEAIPVPEVVPADDAPEATASPEATPIAEPATAEVAPLVEEAPVAGHADRPLTPRERRARRVAARNGKPLATPAKKRSKRSRSKSKSRSSRKRAKRVTRSTRTAAAAPSGKGTLMVSAKPPCRIYIDGRDTGKTTPQRAINLKPGKHKVTLKNRKFNVKTSATIHVKAGRKTRLIRDLSKRIN